MNKKYTKPIQNRALKSQQMYLDAFELLLKQYSYKQITVAQIALAAGLERSAFIKRFGNKRGALEILWQRYIELSTTRVNQLAQDVLEHSSAEAALTHISEVTEALQTEHFSINRAMMDLFEAELQTHPLTKQIFQTGIALMRQVRAHFLPDAGDSDTPVFAATQLLLTLNYNWAIKAMPAMPRNADCRHRLIGEILAMTLQKAVDSRPS